MMPEQRPKPSKTGKTRSILSVPLSPEQRAELNARAGRRPVSAYARGVLFAANDNARPSHARGAAPVRDHAALAQVLAKLGTSESASSLRDLSRLAKLGALPVTPETEAAIQKACADTLEIKILLMTALGIKER